jgi:integrase
MFIYNNYKAGALRTYGTQYNNNLPNDLKSILGDYIIENSLKSGDFLFPHRDTNSFSKSIVNIFKEVADKNLGVNLLRHSYISWFYPKAIGTNEKKRIATMMGTSMNMAQTVYLYKELTHEAPPLYEK